MRKIKVRFFATVTIEQTLEVDTNLSDEEVVKSLNGESDDNVICTSLLKDGPVYNISGSLKEIGKVVEADYDNGEYSDFELLEKEN